MSATLGGIVLAGGRSSRMGSPKATLDWHGMPLVERAVRILARATSGPVVVVRAAGQALPPLPRETIVVDDDIPQGGVLAGIACGLRALAPLVEVAYASATDAPHLHPAFVRRVLAAVSKAVEIALPDAQGHVHPLAAAYRTTLAVPAAALVEQGLLRPAFLFERSRTQILHERDLLADGEVARCDPSLESLVNINEPHDYRRALARPLPRVVVERGGSRRELAAATIADIEGVPGTLEMISLNGEPTRIDARFPLAHGDVLRLAAPNVHDSVR